MHDGAITWLPPKEITITKLTIPRILCVVLALLASRWSLALELKEGQTLAVIGNGFANELMVSGTLQGFLNGHEVKNVSVLNFSEIGGTVSHPSPGSSAAELIEKLRANQVDTVLAFYGLNESYGGTAGLAVFKDELRQWLNQVRTAVAGDAETIKIVLFSPIAHENLGVSHKDGRAHTGVLERYAAAMSEVAGERGDLFVDLFHSSRHYLRRHLPYRLTSNGIHPNEFGVWFIWADIIRKLDWGILATPPPLVEPAAT